MGGNVVKYRITWAMSRIRGMLEGDVPQRKVLERNENE